MKNMTTKAAMEYVETLHQRSNNARYMSICEKVNEAKHALIRERDELESKCNAYDTYVSLCCERGGSYDAFYSFSDSLYDSMRNEMLKHVDDDEEYEAVYDSVRELSDCDVVAMYIELFEVDEAEVFRRLDSACDELRDAVVNEIEYMTDYDENETLHELRNALAETEDKTTEKRRPEPPIIRGAHLSDDESYAICDKCGATSGSWKFVAHGDGLKHYFNTYNCKCGQCITVKYRRAGATW